MIVDDLDPRLVLLDAADADADPSTLRARLADRGLSETADRAVREIFAWARSYLARSHPQLGRNGDVCPFTRPALDRGTFHVAVYPGVPDHPHEVAEVLAGYRDWFRRLEPQEQPLAQFKTILVLFPDLPTEDAPALIDRTQTALKPEYVDAGLMIGEFHDGPPDQGGLWNPDWRPLRSPVPLLAIRHMVPTDCLFLEHDPDLLRAYLKTFRTQVPKHLRARIDAAARRFGLDPLPMPHRRSTSDPLAGLTPAQKRAMLEDLLARDPAEEYPATSPQRRLWFIDRLESTPTASALYTMPGRVRLPAGADHASVEEAFALVLARHEALRTSFRAEAGEPVGVVAPPGDQRLAVRVPERAYGPGSLARLLDRPFSLDVPPLVRAELHRGTEADHLLLSFHHIVADDASIAQVCAEVRTAYDALVQGRTPGLPAVVQFGDYARWVAEQVATGAYEPHRAYWTGRLSGAPDLLPLPTARPRPPQQSFRGAASPFHLDGLMNVVDAVAARSHSTRFMVLSAALGAVLSRLSGSDDIVVGSPVAGRNAAGLESCVGMFVNTVALRTDMSGRPTLGEVLDRTRETVLGALDHQDLPFEEVAAEITRTRALAYNPIFQTMFVLGREDVLGGPVSTTASPEDTVARFDLTVVVIDGAEHLDGWIDYSTDLFDQHQVAAMIDRVAIVLRALASAPETALDDLDLRTDAERLSAEVRSPAPADDVVVAFRRRADERPDDCAVEVLGDQPVRVTYGELERWSAQVSHRLRRAGVRPGEVVAVQAERSAEVVATMLGILRAGAAYLPLDPVHPVERRAALVADSGAVAVVGSPDLPGVDVPVLAFHVTETLPAFDDSDVEVPEEVPAYVIYTSGSTGTPKGVVVHRRGVAELARQFVDVHGLRREDRLLAVPPFSFDASVGDLFPALVSGAALVLCPEPAGLSLTALAGLAEREGVTVVDTAAPLWQEWVAQLRESPGLGARVARSGLRMVWCGGDAVPTAVARDWWQRTGLPVHNHYGPTETTVCATTSQVRRLSDLGEWPTLPVGSALPGVRVQVLDARLRPVPQAVYGEICIGGPGVAHGYLGRPGETAARFVPDPSTPGARMYRTGDIGRWGADGRLEFAGRADDQVKIRGYRIEPGEVEGVLVSHPDVSEAVVTVHDDGATGRRLVAYVVGELRPGALRAQRAEQLPEYLVPSQVVVLDRLPRTSGGKLDRTALRPPDEPAATRPHVDPVTPTERAVAQIWSDLLEVPKVSATDSYFDLGGHSLLAGRVLTRVQDETGVDVPLRVLFAAPDLRAFAGDIDRLGRGEQPIGEQVDLHAEAALPIGWGERSDGAAGGGDLCRPLLTGATGFVGAHLLAEFLGRSERVYCLVRAESVEHGRARLGDALKAYDLFAPDLIDRVVPVLGDLSQPGLGLDQDELREPITAIYHVGAWLSSAHGYRQLAPTNVGAVREILRLGVSAGVPIHHMSTLGVFRARSLDGRRVTEHSALPDDPDTIVGGYEQGKWVADRIMTSARAAGIPVSIYRPARVTGSTRTGAFRHDDLIPMMIRASVDLGRIPLLDRWTIDLTPVDELATDLADLAAGTIGNFHFMARGSVPFSTLAEALDDHGCVLDEVALDEWLVGVRELAHTTRPAYAALLQEFGTTAVARAVPTFDCSITRDQVGRRVLPGDRTMLRRTVRYLIDHGALVLPTNRSVL